VSTGVEDFRVRRQAGFRFDQLRGALLVPFLIFGGACEELPRTYSTTKLPDYAPGELVFSDDFERTTIGEDWKATGKGASIRGGALSVRRLKNHPLWLEQDLPDDVEIEFDAWSDSKDGDIKIELCGDGESFATTTSYTATGYVIIFGGWKNTLDVIARRDEHGKDRIERPTLGVERRQHYHFKITRRGGELSWSIDGKDTMTMQDPEPLRGGGQRGFAFNGWSANTHFDNLQIRAL
jgi:hypothetical protein